MKQNGPQSVYAFYFLNNTHEYGPIDNIMPLLKQVDPSPSSSAVVKKE